MPCVSSVLSSRCRGFMSATASSSERKVTRETIVGFLKWNLKESIQFSCLSKCFSVSGIVSPAQQQIHKMLGEVLGGINCVRVAVVTPYFYTIGE